MVAAAGRFARPSRCSTYLFPARAVVRIQVSGMGFDDSEAPTGCDGCASRIWDRTMGRTIESIIIADVILLHAFWNFYETVDDNEPVADNLRSWRTRTCSGDAV